MELNEEIYRIENLEKVTIFNDLQISNEEDNKDLQISNEENNQPYRKIQPKIVTFNDSVFVWYHAENNLLKINRTNSPFSNTFDLSNWSSGTGGTWENWYVENGTLYQINGSQIDCSLNSLIEKEVDDAMIGDMYSGENYGLITIDTEKKEYLIELKDLNGQKVRELLVPLSKIKT